MYLIIGYLFFLRTVILPFVEKNFFSLPIWVLIINYLFPMGLVLLKEFLEEPYRFKLSIKPSYYLVYEILWSLFLWWKLGLFQCF